MTRRAKPHRIKPTPQNERQVLRVACLIAYRRMSCSEKYSALDEARELLRLMADARMP